MVHSFMIEPDTYTSFTDEAELMEMCKEWSLLSDKATKMKTFYYKGHGLNEACRIIGYIDPITAVIQLENNQKHCIHPSYLKEMQAANYEVKAAEPAEAAGSPLPSAAVAEPKAPKANKAAEISEATETTEDANAAEAIEAPNAAKAAEAAEVAEPAAAPKAKAKKAKKAKLELPEGKVKLIATVKEFTTVPNHFSDNDDEVIIYENVAASEPELEIGDAWSSHSATIKKLELEIGDTITFEAKIVAKKLTRHPVPYKLNNAAKIQKQEG
ncbi:hypothetical protein [Paenibacillus fonticola]|uniref:hypothetical protein n=1 Tax=Paenibacillus fonticola TaxID=379896 RepID=UPI0003753360|nr:hypothetical protein [Paenibacillus fonticola]